MSKLKELGSWYITRSAINDYKERVTDDPILERDYTALDIERRIRSAVNKIDDIDGLPALDKVVVWRTRFTKRGQDYYILINPNQRPRRAVIGIWTETIYQNYLQGITSRGTIYDYNGKRLKL